MPSQAEVRHIAEQIRRGGCPKCRRDEPVDFHGCHWVWSLLVITSWNSTKELTCRSCARQKQFGALAFCFFLGWWGYAGLVVTPIQIIRNIIELAKGAPSEPSKDLLDVAYNVALEHGHRLQIEEPASEPDPDKPWRRNG